MHELMELLRTTVKDIVIANKKDYLENIEIIEANLLVKLPTIISYYFDPQMQSFAMEAPKWTKRYEKLMRSIEGKDLFQIIDVMYYDLYVNLELLSNRLDERGIEHD